MDERGETVESLEEKTGVSLGVWEQVYRMGAQIDEPLAIALEKTWGISSQFWLNLWANYLERIKDQSSNIDQKMVEKISERDS